MAVALACRYHTSTYQKSYYNVGSGTKSKKEHIGCALHLTNCYQQNGRYKFSCCENFVVLLC
jgi:hypothetical protein